MVQACCCFVQKNSNKPVQQTIDNLCRYAVHNNRPGDGEPLLAHTLNKVLCLCQAKIHDFVFY